MPRGHVPARLSRTRRKSLRLVAACVIMSLHLELFQRTSRILGRISSPCAPRATYASVARVTSASRSFSSDADTPTPSPAARRVDMTGLGALVGTIAIPDVTERAASFTGELPVAQSVGSYNWLSGPAEPTIVVPGMLHAPRGAPFSA
jgi:hypothetical protein